MSAFEFINQHYWSLWVLALLVCAGIINRLSGDK